MPLVSDQIELKPEHFNSAGNNPYDGAASLSNIRDTCYGNQVQDQKGNIGRTLKKSVHFQIANNPRQSGRPTAWLRAGASV